MGDAEEPRLETGRVFERVQAIEGLRDHFLHHILTVERRPAHARARPVQPGPQRFDCGQELGSQGFVFCG